MKQLPQARVSDDDWDATLADWLAGLFAAPLSADTVASYRTGMGAVLLEALDDQPGCEAGVLAMAAALAASEPVPSVTRRLGRAFTHLFEGVGGPQTVSPFESVHASQPGRLFQASSTSMERRLHEAQIAPTTGHREPSDHISIELALLAHLIRSGAPLRRQTELLDDHLLAWAPAFAAAVEINDDTGFYAGAASVLVGFLLEKRAALMDRPQQPGRRALPANPNGTN